MIIMESIQIATYALGLIFVIAFASKGIKYARMPIHLRWELYPLAGETKRPWGGSYLEEPEWWTKPREGKSLAGELKFMGKEVLYFKEYFDKNRGLWYIVYPLHVGIFLFIGFFALLLVGALTMVADVNVSGNSSNAWGEFLYYLTLIVGIAAFISGTIGALSLFLRKVIDKTMSPYTRRIEYLNILLVLAIFLTGLISWAAADSTFTIAREYMRSLFSFKEMDRADGVIIAHIILLALFLTYLPFTNMMHFFAKFFTYHMVRWDDAPQLRGSEIERKLSPLLNQQVTWSATHLQDIERWSDVAKSNVEPGTTEGRRKAQKEEI